MIKDLDKLSAKLNDKKVQTYLIDTISNYKRRKALYYIGKLWLLVRLLSYLFG